MKIRTIVLALLVLTIAFPALAEASGPCSQYDIDRDGKVTAMDATIVGKLPFLGNGRVVRTPENHTYASRESDEWPSISDYDLQGLLAHLGETEGDERWEERYDFDFDGQIGSRDLEILKAVWGCLNPDVNGDRLVDIRDVAAIEMAAGKAPLGIH